MFVVSGSGGGCNSVALNLLNTVVPRGAAPLLGGKVWPGLQKL
jgi:hypothetical protein